MGAGYLCMCNGIYVGNPAKYLISKECRKTTLSAYPQKLVDRSLNFSHFQPAINAVTEFAIIWTAIAASNRPAIRAIKVTPDVLINLIIPVE